MALLTRELNNVALFIRVPSAASTSKWCKKESNRGGLEQSPKIAPSTHTSSEFQDGKSNRKPHKLTDACPKGMSVDGDVVILQEVETAVVISALIHLENTSPAHLVLLSCGFPRTKEHASKYMAQNSAFLKGSLRPKLFSSHLVTVMNVQVVVFRLFPFSLHRSRWCGVHVLIQRTRNASSSPFRSSQLVCSFRLAAQHGRRTP